MAEKGKKGKGKKDTAALPVLLKSDDVTGEHKKGDIIMMKELPQQYKKAYNNAWNAVRNGKLKLFQTAVENLIQNSAGTTAESAPLDVYCEKPKITFNDPEKKFAPRMCLLAWCGFHGRLEFAQLLIDKGASVDSGTSVVGSPLLQMMVFHDARPASQLSINTVQFFTEEHPSVLSRIVTTPDNPVTLLNASVLTVALHMKRFDLARYFFTKHKLHPVFCGSRDYPPLFVEYIEYGTFNFIPWLVVDGYETKDEIVHFMDEVTQPGVQEAGQGEGGEVTPGSLAEAVRRTERKVAHAMLLCGNRRGLRFFREKRPDLVKAVDRMGRTALYIAAQEGQQKPVNMLTEMCGDLIWEKDQGGILPLLAAAKAGYRNAVDRILLYMLKDSALTKNPTVCSEMKYCGLAALSYGYQTYFEALHSSTMSTYEVQVLNLPLDATGNTAAHIAAMKGREDTFKALLPSGIPDMIAVLSARNGEGKTPLQLAIDKGHAGIFDTLPAKRYEWREAWKVHNDTLLLYSCVYGNVELVKGILQLGSSPQTRSPKGRSPLSCAAEAGNCDIVSYLLACQHTRTDGSLVFTSPEGSGISEWSPLMLAARNDHAKVCRMLLGKGASVNRPRDPKTNFTPLMVAIDEGNKDVVITILSDKAQGMEAMRVCVTPPGSRDAVDITTPMRMLIEEMPDVAEWMLNRGITQCEVDTTDGETAEAGSNAAVEYSFQFLEDFQDQCPTLPGMRLFRTSDSPRRQQVYRHTVEPVPFDLTNGATGKDEEENLEEAETSLLATPPEAIEGEEAGHEEKMDTVFEEPASPTNSSAPLLTAEAAEGEGVVRSRTQPNNNWGPILYNHKFHPLQIMVSHKRADLLKHPLIVRLLEYKWRKVALPLFLSYISIYLLFVVVLTAFAMVSPRPSPDSSTCVLNSRESDIDALKTNGTCDGLPTSEVDFLYGSAVFLILLSLIYLAVEVVQMVRRRRHYLSEGENYVQVLTFLLSIIYVSGFGNECWCAPSWQWQMGALALFLAWFNLVILLKDMPFAGIPINILFNICLTFVGLVFLPILLIISFALPFYMLFVRDLNALEGDGPGTLTAFLSPSRSLAKTVMQTAGELDFETIFNDADLLYSPSAYILFITFVVIMPILFSNLLVGLAVGDTAEEIEKATFTRTRLQVDFILELESMSAFLRRHMRPLGNRLCYAKKVNRFRQMVLLARGLDYDSQMEIVKELREKDDDFVDALNETGPTHELQVKVEGLRVKTAKVEEDMKVVRGEVGGVEGRLGARLQEVEKCLREVKGILEQLVNSNNSQAQDDD